MIGGNSTRSTNSGASRIAGRPGMTASTMPAGRQAEAVPRRQRQQDLPSNAQRATPVVRRRPQSSDLFARPERHADVCWSGGIERGSEAISLILSRGVTSDVDSEVGGQGLAPESGQVDDLQVREGESA